MTDHRQDATLAAEAALREAAGDFATDAALGFIRPDRSSEAYFRDSLPTLADGVIDAAAPHLAAAERERIAAFGASKLAGRVAYTAFATMTRTSLDLPAWEALPPDVRADWHATADAVLMTATSTTNPEGTDHA